MTPDLIQFAYYAGFALMGWWLRHQGALAPSSPSPLPSPVVPVNPPPGPVDQRALLDLLKSLLDRLAQPTPPPPMPPTGTVFHVPIEVAANPRVPARENAASP